MKVWYIILMKLKNKMTKAFKYVLIIFFLLNSHSFAKEDFFAKAIKLFDNEKYEESKFLFQRNIVFNPKNSKSYLYLAKIFNQNENEQNEELNLNSVLILNPKNDEALYMMILLKIKQYDYAQAKQLIKKFDLVCKSFCSKKAEIEEKFSKLVPDNAKDNN